jgi:hypothetical protein
MFMTLRSLVCGSKVLEEPVAYIFNDRSEDHKPFTWSDNKVREFIAVEVLYTSLLNITVVTFKALPLGSYAPMPASSPPFEKILELVLWNGLQSCRCITPDVINMPSFQYFLHLQEQKKGTGG